jgi:mRNA interferase RelE/StbE
MAHLRPYQIVFTRAALRGMNGLPREILRRLDAAILGLAHDPRPSGAEKLTGYDFYRIRVGDYRIIYQVEDERLVIVVIRVAHRRQIYRHL